jgi:hypothetical protein
MSPFLYPITHIKKNSGGISHDEVPALQKTTTKTPQKKNKISLVTTHIPETLHPICLN